MKRQGKIERIIEEFRIHPVVAILGPRQCGKTTLAHQYIKSTQDVCHHFDLENPEDLAALSNPKALFESLKGTIIIDEIQRRPEFFPYLRFLVDKEKRKRKILILGSASRDLIQQSTESLAGRISYIELTPFLLTELSIKKRDPLWERGGYPLSFLAENTKDSFRWRKSYISTFLERDIPALGIRIPAPTMRRFWEMIAHYHGQVVNYTELSRSFGVSDKTIRHYLDILTETFMIRQLRPWHENIKKRQVKKPKIYIRDSGIFHSLLSVESKRSLLSHPKLGASWEGFALEQLLGHFGLNSEEVFFWSVHQQGELDLFFQKDGKRYGVEFKFSDYPTVSKSMRYSKEQLKLDYMYYIYPGERKIELEKNIIACGLSNIKKLKLF